MEPSPTIHQIKNKALAYEGAEEHAIAEIQEVEFGADTCRRKIINLRSRPKAVSQLHVKIKKKK
jgi:hypothetical protein